VIPQRSRDRFNTLRILSATSIAGLKSCLGSLQGFAKLPFIRIVVPMLYAVVLYFMRLRCSLEQALRYERQEKVLCDQCSDAGRGSSSGAVASRIAGHTQQESRDRHHDHHNFHDLRSREERGGSSHVTVENDDSTEEGWGYIRGDGYLLSFLRSQFHIAST
jgi:hypothetical protein